MTHLNCDPPTDAELGDLWTDPDCGQQWRAIHGPDKWGNPVDWELVN